MPSAWFQRGADQGKRTGEFLGAFSHPLFEFAWLPKDPSRFWIWSTFLETVDQHSDFILAGVATRIE